MQTEETEKVNVSEDTVEVRDKSSEQKVDDEVPTSAPTVTTSSTQVVTTATANVTTSSMPVFTTASPITILEVEEDIQDDDMVLADALVRMKGAKLKGVSIRDVESAEVEKQERSVLTLRSLPKIDPKEKVKVFWKKSLNLKRKR